MADLKIADSDGEGTSGFLDLFQNFPGAQITSGNRPVDQIKIYIIQFQAIQTALEGSADIAKTLCCVPDFGSNKKFTSGNPALCDPASYIFFVFVNRSSVDQTIAIFYGGYDRTFGFILTSGLIYTKPQKRHLSVCIQKNGIFQNNSSNSSYILHVTW